MQTIAIIVVLAAVAYAQHPQTLPVLQRTEIRDEAGQFSQSYSTHDGQHFAEQGVLKRTNDGLDNVLVKQGSFQYVSPEGIPIRVTYTADEYGFHPEGAHLPVAPIAPQTTF